MPQIDHKSERKLAKIAIRAVAGVALLALAACIGPAPYAPRQAGQATGYTDRQLAPNRYRVTFTGNSATSREEVEDYLLRRAAEVTVAAGYSHFVFDSRDTMARTQYDVMGYPRRPFGPAFGPGFGFWSFHPRWGYDPLGPDVDIITTTQYQAYAEIVLLNDADAAREPRAVDARVVLQNIPVTAAPQPGR
jgi:hypothetical protein